MHMKDLISEFYSLTTMSSNISIKDENEIGNLELIARFYCNLESQ